jgi:post-segregation antitoxin (ccd killing protein)
MVRRMPRMQVYLPEHLYREVKARGLPASELLQQAVEAEVQRQRLNEEADRWVEEMIAELGEPSTEDEARAEGIVRRILDRAAERGGA